MAVGQCGLDRGSSAKQPALQTIRLFVHHCGACFGFAVKLQCDHDRRSSAKQAVRSTTSLCVISSVHHLSLYSVAELLSLLFWKLAVKCHAACCCWAVRFQ